jgi:hypothetical protein
LCTHNRSSSKVSSGAIPVLNSLERLTVGR